MIGVRGSFVRSVISGYHDFAYSSSCCGSYTWITRIMASNVMKKAVQNSSLRTNIGLNPVYNAMGPSTRAMLVNASTMPVYTSRPPAWSIKRVCSAAIAHDHTPTVLHDAHQSLPTFTTSDGVEMAADAKPATALAPRKDQKVSPRYGSSMCFVWSYLLAQQAKSRAQSE